MYLHMYVLEMGIDFILSFTEEKQESVCATWLKLPSPAPGQASPQGRSQEC